MIRRMDVLLLQANERAAKLLVRGLPAGYRVVRGDARVVASGAWWPDPRRTCAIVLAADTPDATALQVVYRWRAAEQQPAGYLVTTAGSDGEALMRRVGGPVPVGAAALHWRAAAGLGLTALLMWERWLNDQKA